MDLLDLEDQYIIIGKRIRSLRKKRGWSQSALGAKADLEKTAIQRIERGYNSTLKTLLKLAIAFKLSLSEMLSLSNDISNPSK